MRDFEKIMKNYQAFLSTLFCTVFPSGGYEYIVFAVAGDPVNRI